MAGTEGFIENVLQFGVDAETYKGILKVKENLGLTTMSEAARVVLKRGLKYNGD
jgi:hypothetical protein